MKTGWKIGPGAWGKAALCLWLAGACAASGGEARRHFAEAEALHERGENAAAAEAFLRAAEAADREGEGLDGDVARFNALAVGADSLPDEALGGGDKSADLELRAALHYNRGRTWMEKGIQLEKKRSELLAALSEGRVGDATEMALLSEDAEKPLMERAVDEYREAVLLAPGVTEYQQNFELAQRRLAELKQATEKEQPSPGEDGEGEQERLQPDENGPYQLPDENSEEEQEQQQGEGSEGEQQEGEQQESAEASEQKPGEQMTEGEALLLLDAMRDREQQLRDAMHLLPGRQVPVEKDW